MYGEEEEDLRGKKRKDGGVRDSSPSHCDMTRHDEMYRRLLSFYYLMCV